MFVRIDFLQWLGQPEINIIEAHLPLLNPVSYLTALFTILPFLGFGVECLLSRIDNGSCEGARHLKKLIVVVLRLGDRSAKRVDSPIESGNGNVQLLGLLAKYSRQSITL